jgi:hypothetical protein
MLFFEYSKLSCSLISSLLLFGFPCVDAKWVYKGQETNKTGSRNIIANAPKLSPMCR